jgi:hypothetical protein
MTLPFKLHISKEQVEGKEALPEGLYEVRFIKFSPKWTNQGNLTEEQWKAARSINLRAEYEVLKHPEYAGTAIYDTLNVGPKTPLFGLMDMCHAFGLNMDYDKDSESYEIPGMDSVMHSPNFDPEKPETWEYRGPLIGKVAQVEIGHRMFNGKPQPTPRRWFCAIPDCASRYPTIRHSQNMIRA